MEHWLQARLTPAKEKEARWVELALALERIWGEFFDPAHSRVERLRSNYQADAEDLKAKIRQMGDYFSFDLPRKENHPIAVGWRRLELEYKDMELLLQSVFRRHYGDLPVAWLPIFAPIDETYGSVFIPADGPLPQTKTVAPEGCFLTSRGMLAVEHTHLFKLGLNKQTFLDHALAVVRKAKPLHIVYGGALWYARFDIDFEFIFKCLWEREGRGYDLKFSVLGSRFDFTAADAAFLDIQKALCQWEREIVHELTAFPPWNYWHLDKHLPDSFGDGWLPADITICGNETDLSNPLSLVTHIREETPQLAQEGMELVCQNQTDALQELHFQCLASGVLAPENYCSLAAFPPHHRWSLDRYPRFDECAADFAPLDMPIGGYAYA